jgi:hypothetical protein
MVTSMITILFRGILLGAAVTGAVVLGQPHPELAAEGREAQRKESTGRVSGEPVLWRKVAVPDALLAGAGFAGDLRLGDLDGDGHVEFLVYRSTAGGVKPCFLGAFTVDGEVLWKAGSAGEQPVRPGSVAVYDLDGDGADEVICFFARASDDSSPHRLDDVSIQVRNGATGTTVRQAAPKEVREASGRDANWVHQRILVANLRGTARACDTVVKLGTQLLAFDDHLRVLWVYRIPWNEYSRCSAYIPAVGDIDGDGHDEVNGGYFVLESDGTPRWAAPIARHMDSVAIVPWGNGTMRAICSGFGHVLDADGNVILKLGEKVVPHGQEVRVADFLPQVPGPEMLLRCRGHTPDVITVGVGGAVLHRFRLNPTPNNTGMDAVYWLGAGKPALLVNGGALWRGNGETFAEFQDLPAVKNRGRMDWFHAIPADVCSDAREEVVLYNPWDRFVWIFSPAPVRENEFKRYRPTPRQYNVRLMD